MKINQRQKLLISFGVALLLLILWYMFILMPQRKSIADTGKKINEINLKIRKSGNTVSNLPKIKERLTAMDTEFDSLVTLLPTKDSIAIITDAIVNLCAMHNLTVEEIEPSLDALLGTSDYFVEVPIGIKLKGSFLNLGRFTEDLKSLPFYYYQSEYDFERRPEELDLTIKIDSYIYVINPKGKI